MTREELLQQDIYCPEVFDNRIIIYLRLGFKVLLSYTRGLTYYYYILTFDPSHRASLIRGSKLNKENFHIVKNISDIVINDTNHKSSIINPYYITNIRSHEGIKFFSLCLNETNTLEQYINNFRYGHSD